MCMKYGPTLLSLVMSFSRQKKILGQNVLYLHRTSTVSKEQNYWWFRTNWFFFCHWIFIFCDEFNKKAVWCTQSGCCTQSSALTRHTQTRIPFIQYFFVLQMFRAQSVPKWRQKKYIYIEWENKHNNFALSFIHSIDCLVVVVVLFKRQNEVQGHTARGIGNTPSRMTRPVSTFFPSSTRQTLQWKQFCSGYTLYLAAAAAIHDYGNNVHRT